MAVHAHPDDEAIATVVTPAAQYGYPSLELGLVGGFHRRDDLAAGILHQHERWNTDFLDGETVGLAHLRGVENSHER